MNSLSPPKVPGTLLFVGALLFNFLFNPVVPALLSPSWAADISNNKNDAAGIWAFFMLDLRAPNLLKMSDKQADNLLQIKNPYVAGLAPRFAWSTLNPEAGKYYWDPVDRIIDRAKAYRKKVVLRIIGGGDPALTPEWVWKRIKYVGRQSNKGKPGFRIPIIWDNEYLSAWDTFIKALGNRYDSNPYVQRVSITSGHAGELWYLWGDRMTNDQIEKVLKYGFEDNFVGAWEKIIDTYAVAFPTKAFTLDLAKTVNKISFMDDEGKEAAITNYAVSRFGSRLYLQQDGLNENTETEGKLTSHILMKKHASNGNIIGFQTLMPAEHGNLKRAFERGLAYPISYIEVYTKDLRDPDQQDSIHFLYEGLGQ